MLRRLLTFVAVAVALTVVVSLVSPDGLRDTYTYLDLIHSTVVHVWSLIRPGGAWHPSKFIEIHGHLVIEGILCAIITYLVVFQSSFKPRKHAERPLTEAEMQELCEEWEPEPLEGTLTSFQKAWLDAEPEVLSAPGRIIHIRADREMYAIDMSTLNILGLAGESRIREAARETIHKYGVGSCGPRGFYGTLDVHLALEDRLAAYMGSEEAILYSYDLATIPSILPAFANRKDLIVIDEACSWPTWNGAVLSRARVMPFRHNDVDDLKRVLQAVALEDRLKKRPLNRRFIVVEGIYANTGEIAPLADIMKLKEKYKYRLVVDESISLGVLGPGGRGAIEEAGLKSSDVEIIGASLGNALASIGGFCSGDREIVDHQRLSGAGYCFSASLPPYLAATTMAALDVLEQEGHKRATKVRELARLFRSKVGEASQSPGLFAVGGKESADSPLIHLRLSPEPPRECWDVAELILLEIAQNCLNKSGILVSVSKYSNMLENWIRPPPSLRVVVSAAHQASDIEDAVEGLTSSCKRVLERHHTKEEILKWV